jgi:hypothetical protein
MCWFMSNLSSHAAHCLMHVAIHADAILDTVFSTDVSVVSL